MKTAVSIPDRLFREADRLARRLDVPRSVLYARALAAFVEAHRTQDVTRRLDEVYAREDSRLPADVEVLQETSLLPEREEDQW